MSFARRRAVGLWIDGSTVSGAEWESFDADLAEAVDGRGGAYVLTSPLELGGDDLIVGENIEVGGDVSVGGAFQVTGNSDLVGNVVIGTSVADQFTVNADGLYLGDSVFSGLVTFGDAVTFEDDVQVDGGLSVDGTVGIGGTLTVTSATTLNGAFACTDNYFLGDASSSAELWGTIQLRGVMSHVGVGKIAWRQQVVATDTDQDCIAAQVDTFYVPDGVFTAAHIVIIDDTGASNGMRVYFHNHDPDWGLTVRDPLGNNLDTLLGVTKTWGFAERIGGVWKWAKGEVT